MAAVPAVVTRKLAGEAYRRPDADAARQALSELGTPAALLGGGVLVLDASTGNVLDVDFKGGGSTHAPGHAGTPLGIIRRVPGVLLLRPIAFRRHRVHDLMDGYAEVPGREPHVVI